MYYKFLTQKDSYISKLTGSANFGKDEILKISRDIYSDEAYPIRTIMQFDMTAISQSMVNGTIGTGSQFELKLFECYNNNNIIEDFYVDAFIVTSSWAEGTGSLYGAYASGAVSWDSSSIGNSWGTPGSDFNSTISASQYFPSSSGDLTMNVTELISGSIVGTYKNNYGLLLKLRDESSIIDQGPINFYSRQTHTIYEPSLFAKWEDAYSTNSISASDSYQNYVITLRRPQSEYYKNDKVYFELFTRNYYPTLGFSQSIEEISSIPLTDLLYAIEDIETQEMIIPFDTYTSCSYNDTNNYFYVNMQSLQSQRYYILKLKHNFFGGQIIYNLHKFKVI